MKVKELIDHLVYCDPEAIIAFEEGGGGMRAFARDIDFKHKGNMIDNGPFLAAYGAVIRETDIPVSKRFQD